MDENIPVNDIFRNLPTLSPDEYEELFNDFVEKLNHNENLNHSEELETTNQKKTRLKLVRALLSVCALGTTFNEEVYSYTLDFILRKELCILPVSLN